MCGVREPIEFMREPLFDDLPEKYQSISFKNFKHTGALSLAGLGGFVACLSLCGWVWRGGTTRSTLAWHGTHACIQRTHVHRDSVREVFSSHPQENRPRLRDMFSSVHPNPSGWSNGRA